jgi:hypothetical protein
MKTQDQPHGLDPPSTATAFTQSAVLNLNAVNERAAATFPGVELNRTRCSVAQPPSVLDLRTSARRRATARRDGTRPRTVLFKRVRSVFSRAAWVTECSIVVVRRVTTWRYRALYLSGVVVPGNVVVVVVVVFVSVKWSMSSAASVPRRITAVVASGIGSVVRSLLHVS